MEEIGMNQMVKFENFIIEARECNTITQRTIYLENDHKYSFAPCKRMKKRKMQMKLSLETKDTDEYSEPILSKISSKYPRRMKNIKRKRKYFNTMYSASENGLNTRIQMMKNPTEYFNNMYDEFGNHSSLNQNSNEYCYPVSMVNTSNEFDYSDNKLSAFENYLNGPIQMKNHPETYYEETEGKGNYSSLNNNSNEFCYPVIMVNTSNEFEYPNSKFSTFENDFDKFIEPSRNPLETAPEEIEKYGKWNSTQISCKCNYPIRIGNTNEGFKYNYRCSECENDLNGLIQMQRKSPKPCSDSAQDDCNDSSLNQISSEYDYPVTKANLTEKSEYFSNNCNKFENDLNGSVQMQRQSPETCSDEAQEDYNTSILNQISGDYDNTVTTANPTEGFEYFSNNYSKFENDLNGSVQMQRKSPEIYSDEAQEDFNDSILNEISCEHDYPVTTANPVEEFEYSSNNYSKFENDLNEPMHMQRKSPEIYSDEAQEDCNGSVLNQILSEYGYPVTMANPTKEFEYFNNNYNMFENYYLNGPVQMQRKSPEIYSDEAQEDCNNSILNQISDKYGYPVATASPTEEFEYFNNNYSKLENDLNGSTQMWRKSPELCSDEMQEDCNGSILNQLSGEYDYNPVTTANPAEEFQYFNNNCSKFENDYNGLNEMSNTPKQFLAEIEKDEESSLNLIFSKYDHSIKMKNANEDFKSYGMCSRCKNNLNEPIQMNPPTTYFEKSEENSNESCLNHVSDEYDHCLVNPDERSKYFSTECNEFENDFNGPTKIRCPLQESNPTDREINVTINLKDAFSLAKNCIDRILLDRESLFNPELCNLLDIVISENEVSNIKNQIRQKFSKRRLREKFRKNKIYKATLKNERNRYLHPFVKKRKLKNIHQYVDANLKHKRNGYLHQFVKKKNLKKLQQSQNFANGTMKNSRNYFLHVSAKKNNLLNIQQSQNDFTRTEQAASEQKCCPGEGSPKLSTFESERPLFFVVDECNESNLPLQGEEEIINFNSMFSEREDEFVTERNVQKHFKRKTNASFIRLDKESSHNNKTDSVQFQNKTAPNYVSSNQDSWQNPKWDSSSSSSSTSEVDGKRSWKNFERSYFKK